MRPRHGWRCQGNQVHVNEILLALISTENIRINLDQVPGQHTGHVLAENASVRREGCLAGAIDDAMLSGPVDGFGIEATDGNIGKIAGGGIGRTSKSVENRHEHGTVDCSCGGKQPLTDSVHQPHLGAEGDGLKIPAFNGNIIIASRVRCIDGQDALECGEEHKDRE